MATLRRSAEKLEIAPGNAAGLVVDLLVSKKTRRVNATVMLPLESGRNCPALPVDSLFLISQRETQVRARGEGEELTNGESISVECHSAPLRR